MSSILRNLPFFGEPSTAHLPDGAVIPILADQIIVWVSLTPSGGPNPARPRRFPAVFDTGYTGTLLVPEQQLIHWAGIAPQQLGWAGSFRTGGRWLPLYDADVFIHPNRPGTRDEFADRHPFRLELEEGIGVWPSTIPGARRLPLLGLRAVCQAGLRAIVNGRRRRVWLGAGWSFWPFG